MKRLSVILFCLLLYTVSRAQNPSPDFSGKYSYSVVDTPYGDYYGWITLRKKGRAYHGEIINEEGVNYMVRDVRVKQGTITFKSNVEETNSYFTCTIEGDSIYGSIKVKGDDFPYVLKGKRMEEK